MQLHGLLEEAQLGMHPWQPPALQRPGKRAKTREQACPTAAFPGLEDMPFVCLSETQLTILPACDALALLSFMVVTDS